MPGSDGTFREVIPLTLQWKGRTGSPAPPKGSSRYNSPVTRTVLLIGLMLLAAILPLAALPPALAVLVVASLVFLARVTLFVSDDAQPVALRALRFFRAPPSR